MRIAAEIVFWLSAAALFYTYAGYPLLVFMISSLRPRPVKQAEFLPTVSVIITAYNEERHLKEKLENTLALDYPSELLEIIVASDCSSDRTDEIARGAHGQPAGQVGRFAGNGALLTRPRVRSA